MRSAWPAAVRVPCFCPFRVAWALATYCATLRLLLHLYILPTNDTSPHDTTRLNTAVPQQQRALHAPCTMHHAPCTMHHAPCTMHHAPRTTHHAPCTMAAQQSVPRSRKEQCLARSARRRPLIGRLTPFSRTTTRRPPLHCVYNGFPRHELGDAAHPRRGQ